MVGGSKTPEIPSNQPVETSNRWDFLKKPIQAIGHKFGFGSERNDSFVQLPSRRTLLKGAAITAGVGVVGGFGVLKASERSLQGEDETFKVGSDEVQVSWKEFDPKKIKDPSEVVLVLPGMPGRAKAPVLWTLPEQLAEGFEAKTFMIDGRPKGLFQGNSTDLEVEGIRQFLVKNNIKKVSIVGHSVGSVKAANLAVSLEQNNPDIQIRGVALANPIGFYEQTKEEDWQNVRVELPNMSKLANPKTPQKDKDPLQAGWQILGSYASEISATGLGYPKLVSDQIDMLTKVNPKLSKVKAPVVVLVAKEDHISQVQKIFPNIPEPGKNRKQMAEIGKERKQYLKQSVLPEASNIEVIEASKFASHAAFGERPYETGRVLTKLFDRLKRPKTGARAA